MERYHRVLRQLLAKAVSLNGIQFVPPASQNPLDMGVAVKGFLERAIAAADPNEVAATIQRAHDAGPGSEAARSLNALRIEQINNFILPSADIAPRFFQVINLAEDERPAIQFNTKQETTARYIGADGDVRRVKILPNQTEVLIDLRMLWSDEVEYRIRDLYRGNIEENALKTVDIAFDLAVKLDDLAWTLLATAFGSFTTSGSKSARTYVAHSGIDTNNLPSTNDITLTTNTGATKFREEVLKATLAYCDAWGNAFPDGPLRPTGEIIMPSSETTDILSSVSFSGAVDNPTAEDLRRDYTGVTYGKVAWKFVPSNKLPKKTCYPVLNKPVGTIYFKPSMDESYDDGGTVEARRKNIGSRSMMKVVGMYIPLPRTINALRVKYTT